MGSGRLSKRARHLAAELPDTVMHAILSQLDFKSKIMAGQVNKKWDQLLKAGNVGARHWEIDYKVDSLASSKILVATDEEAPTGQQFDSTVGRCVTVLTLSYSSESN